jgi:hypothetical protein
MPTNSSQMTLSKRCANKIFLCYDGTLVIYSLVIYRRQITTLVHLSQTVTSCGEASINFCVEHWNYRSEFGIERWAIFISQWIRSCLMLIRSPQTEPNCWSDDCPSTLTTRRREMRASLPQWHGMGARLEENGERKTNSINSFGSSLPLSYSSSPGFYRPYPGWLGLIAKGFLDLLHCRWTRVMGKRVLQLSRLPLLLPLSAPGQTSACVISSEGGPPRSPAGFALQMRWLWPRSQGTAAKLKSSEHRVTGYLHDVLGRGLIHRSLHAKVEGASFDWLVMRGPRSYAGVPGGVAPPPPQQPST